LKVGRKRAGLAASDAFCALRGNLFLMVDGRDPMMDFAISRVNRSECSK
jgi:hypothetical protein